MIHYDRRLKVYTSDIVCGVWKERLDAEAAELPRDLIDRAAALADTLAVAVKAARLVASGGVVKDGQPDRYKVKSQSSANWHVVDLANGCDCEAFGNGIACSHWVAALLVASDERDSGRDSNAVENIIDELYGQPEVVRDEAGRIFFGSE
jgi:hypothetical protein